MQNLGRHVGRTREFLGLTQQELGRRAGVSQGAVSRFEGGRAFSTPFLAIVRLNVALAPALRALDASTKNIDVTVEVIDTLGTVVVSSMVTVGPGRSGLVNDTVCGSNNPHFGRITGSFSKSKVRAVYCVTTSSTQGLCGPVL